MTGQSLAPLNAKMSSISRRTFVKGSTFTLLTGLSASPLSARVIKPDGFRLGVNLAGAEFRTIGGRWKWPKLDNLAYYLDKGFNVYRVPFKWERLQPQLNTELEEGAMTGLDEIVRRATGAGAVVLLDAHDYGRREKQIIGGDPASPITAAAFADFWGRIARRYKANPLVWYNLMNEPHDQPAQGNLEAQNAACAAIRAAGARSKVLFSGVAWTGAHSWVRSSNAQMMLQVRDPASNYAYDAHQYLDKGFGGSSLEALPGVGARILKDICAWGEQHGKQIFLGEFGTGPSPASIAELDALLGYMVAHKSVFIGGTYFAGGGTWGRKLGSSDPVDGVDKPQTLLMERYLRW